jgi:hypothetical protein
MDTSATAELPQESPAAQGTLGRSLDNSPIRPAPRSLRLLGVKQPSEQLGFPPRLDSSCAEKRPALRCQPMNHISVHRWCSRKRVEISGLRRRCASCARGGTRQ